MLNMKEHADALRDLVQAVTVADNLPVSDRKKLNLFSMVLYWRISTFQKHEILFVRVLCSVLPSGTMAH